MSSQQIPYPQGPESVPADLVATTTRYRIQIILTLFGILLFWVFYLMLVAGTAYLLYWSFMYDIGRNAGRGEYFLKIASIAVTGMLFIFTLKFLFKPRPAKDPLQVPISPKDHPTLFAFIKRLASETGAPTPKKVFVSPEINASVFYNNPFLSLFP
jgi:hypothetical protein